MASKFSCTTHKYDQLYARWLRNPGTLLDLAEYQPGQRVLDLCGGTGAIALEAIRRGADPSTITLVDLNPRCHDPRIEQIRTTALAYLEDRNLNSWSHDISIVPYDFIIIRQAAAYLQWDRNLAWNLKMALSHEGKLVFNTFANPRWGFQSYVHGGRRFLEFSAYFGKTCWHLQASPMIGVDVSRFKYLPSETLVSILEPYFNVTLYEEGKSCRWVCVPKRNPR